MFSSEICYECEVMVDQLDPKCGFCGRRCHISCTRGDLKVYTTILFTNNPKCDCNYISHPECDDLLNKCKLSKKMHKSSCELNVMYDILINNFDCVLRQNDLIHYNISNKPSKTQTINACLDNINRNRSPVLFECMDCLNLNHRGLPKEEVIKIIAKRLQNVTIDECYELWKKLHHSFPITCDKEHCDY